MRIRLDECLVKKGLAKDLSLAQSFVMEGRVFLGQERLRLPSMPVEPDSALWLKPENPYVSRGGLKLERALEEFRIDLDGRVCMDIGSSTGGFTECMLKNGAKTVYSIDVGYGLLDWKLRQDERVRVMERTNAKNLLPGMFPERASFASMDLSFISVKKVLPTALSCMPEEAALVVLVKPQFEAPRGRVGKGGIVRERAVHEAVLSDILAFLPKAGLYALGLIPSPIKGMDGNTEFLLHAARGVGLRYNDLNLQAILDFVWN
ncbi:MAG: TlyA family RNA methyltransferase [Christensenellaceae bacterium]|jgi:23S rRNA (cytidine1920-2'-O)/16S rRNA (cytidine1409-2'-O)-methyltransferase|nr:TlyA family RNA methyltransferase [Christensenellaceae bacterium]